MQEVLKSPSDLPHGPILWANWGHKIADVIALIHPTQWTIAIPVGTTGPTK